MQLFWLTLSRGVAAAAAATASIALLAAVLAVLPASAPPAVQTLASDPPSLAGASAVLVDGGTGRVLWERDAGRPHYPASITKILTAVIALERARPEEVVTVDEEAARTEGSRLVMMPGERLTMEQLLYALLLGSANDAAVAIAKHVAGSVAGFAVLMNERARELGATVSHFTNPHGLPDPAHVTTARDMGRITVHAMGIPAFRRIVATERYEIPWPERDRTRVVHNHNYLLGEGGINGVKSGYTRAARHTMVASEERDGRLLIAVVLRTTRTGRWRDARSLLGWGWRQVRWEPVYREGEIVGALPVANREGVMVPIAARVAAVPLRPGERGALSVRPELPPAVEAPLRQGDRVGEAVVLLEGEEIARVPLVAWESVEAPPPPAVSPGELLRHWLRRLSGR